MSVAVKPMLHIVLTFAIVWFYRGLLSPLSPVASTVALVVLAVPTWVVVSRLLFNASRMLAVMNDEPDRAQRERSNLGSRSGAFRATGWRRSPRSPTGRV